MTQTFLDRKMGKSFAIVFRYTFEISTYPKVPAFILKNTINPTRTKALPWVKMQKILSIKFCNSSRKSTGPYISTFVNKHTRNQERIAGVFFNKLRKTCLTGRQALPIICQNTTAKSAKPYIPIFIFSNSLHGIFYSFFFGEMPNTLTIIF